MSLRAKILVLVIGSLVFELAAVGWLASLQAEAESKALRAQQAKDVAQAVNTISETLVSFVTSLRGSKLSSDFVGARDVGGATRVFEKQYKILKKALKNEPEKLAVVTKSETAATEGLSIFRLLQAGPDQLDSLNSADVRHKYNVRLRSLGKEILSEELLEISREEKIIGQRTPEEERAIRQIEKYVFIGFVMLQVVIAFVSAIVLIKGVSSRLSLLLDNTYRLASGVPLNEPVKGNDEIARLDNKFHEMSNALAEATRKERATVDNARDLICSIDEQGRFVAVNPAAKEVLGYEQDELLGRYYIDTVRTEDANEVLASMERVASGAETRPFDVAMSSKDGELVDTLWTVQWSEEEKSFSCVIHDEHFRKEAERLRQEVVAMITHDLRTPLSTIRNFLEMLDADLFGSLNEKGKHMLKLADTNSSRMMSLINDLLDIEKIKAGTMELAIEEVPLDSILQQTADSLGGIAQVAGIKFDVAKTDLVVNCDEDKISRVMTNLLYNAVKFSPRDSAIAVTVEANDGFAHISIIDQGRGIPADMLETIFDRFSQVEASDHRSKGGSGLGLAICKALVEMHHGTIWVESEAGRGATFTFTLPINLG